MGTGCLGSRDVIPVTAGALALVVLVRVPNVQVKQAPERLHFRNMRKHELKFGDQSPNKIVT
jgi:hypothetical protein